MRRHWVTALVPVIALVVAAGVVGLKRTPQYTATADLSVVPVYTNNPGAVSSVIQAAQSLASVYSRAIDAKPVEDDTARRLGQPSLPAQARLSATPLPETPLIRVTAVSTSSRQAVELANEGSAALADYLNERRRTDDEARVVSARYRRAALRYRRRLEARDEVAREYEQHPTDHNRGAVERASAAADTALLQRDALLTSYQNAVQGAGANPSVEVFSPAQSASSDRYTVLQILVFAGLIAGLLAGAALAVLQAQREVRVGSGR